MNNDDRKPIMQVFGGPSGSGKSTVLKTGEIKPIGIYTNSDEIQKKDNVNREIAKEKVWKQREESLFNRDDFSFESTLSKDEHVAFMQTAKNQGYEIQCIYVLTYDVEINLARIKGRYLGGGHDIPQDKTRIRYESALKLLPEVFEVCDKIVIYDNTGDEASVIAEKDANNVKITQNQFWSESTIMRLISNSNE